MLKKHMEWSKFALFLIVLSRWILILKMQSNALKWQLNKSKNKQTESADGLQLRTKTKITCRLQSNNNIPKSTLWIII